MVIRLDIDVTPRVLTLQDDRARDPSLVGSKAAALARAASLDLPVLPGFVLTVDACETIAGERWYGLRPELTGALRAAWEGISEDGRHPLVVRSSSTGEDGIESSMAGMFRSVLGVRDWMAFLDALGIVLASAFERSRGGTPAPMAVLVQPQLEPSNGGVLFGVDPVSGRTDRLSVAAVRGGPDKLVSGRVAGSHYTLTPRGRVVGRPSTGEPQILDRGQAGALARLAADARTAFGVPQDIEWAFDVDGDLWLLQSRPITRVSEAPVPASEPVMGPGPIAETFPNVMGPLEQELWLDPLRDGARHALLLAGAHSKKAVLNSSLVVCVEGRAAADLAILGPPKPRKGLLRKLDPRPAARRLRASWRVGRLRAGLPSSVRVMLSEIDDQLGRVPAIAGIETEALVRLLHNARAYLVAIHANEMLMGLLLDRATTTDTAASAALATLIDARRRSLTDAEIERAHPEVLALVAPRLFRDRRLPHVEENARGPRREHDDGDALLREALRLRARLVQELMARATKELAARALSNGGVEHPRQVRLLSLDELCRAVAGVSPSDLGGRKHPQGPPLPAAFTFSDGAIRSVRVDDAPSTGASAGRTEGVVTHDASSAGAGHILVTQTLDPSLASILPAISGVVAETGSPLSHLAILAREFAVPAVVGYADALQRLPAGCRVVIDGSTGEVTIIDEVHAL